jgi:hypothetical protein
MFTNGPDSGESDVSEAAGGTDLLWEADANEEKPSDRHLWSDEDPVDERDDVWNSNLFEPHTALKSYWGPQSMPGPVSLRKSKLVTSGQHHHAGGRRRLLD